jgi:hypothetical protein
MDMVEKDVRGELAAEEGEVRVRSEVEVGRKERVLMSSREGWYQK